MQPKGVRHQNVHTSSRRDNVRWMNQLPEGELFAESKICFGIKEWYIILQVIS